MSTLDLPVEKLPMGVASNLLYIFIVPPAPDRTWRTDVYNLQGFSEGHDEFFIACRTMFRYLTQLRHRLY